MRKESKRDVTPVISIRGYRRGVVAYLFFSGTPTAYYQHLSFQPCAFFFTTTRPRGANGQQKNYLIMKKVLFALVAMSLLFTACEDGNDDYIKLKEVDDVCTMMDDLNFMAYCYEEFDVNKDGKVSMSEAAAATTISRPKGIKSIKGIEYFINVSVLNIIFDSYAMDLDFTPLKKLELLEVYFDRDPDKTRPKVTINVKNNKVLRCFDVGPGNINDLDFSKHPNLTYVELKGVVIDNLNLANGNDVTVWLTGAPACTIWLKSGQKLDDESYYDKEAYTIKYKK